MIKVILSANSCWYLYNYKSSLIKILLKKYEVHCLAPKDKYTKYLKKMGAKHHQIKLHNTSTNPFKEFLSIINLFYCIKKTKPNVLLNFTIKNNIYGTICAKYLDIPFANNTAGLGNSFVNSNLIFLCIRFIYGHFLKKSDFVFTQNRDDYKYLVQNLKISKKKICLVPGSGINTKINIYQKKKNLFFTLLYLGRFIENKGILDLFEAFQNIYKNVKTIKLVLAGYKKNDKSQIPYALIRKFKKHEAISVVNFSDKNIKLIKNCSCVILPSYREGMPRSLLEAGLLKKISIAANVPGCRDIIKNGYNGYLFQKGNVSDLEKKIMKVYNLKKFQLNKIQNNARLRVISHFDEQVVIQKTLNFIKKSI
jgi:glycosyltransferase involved in cell wall biosynthesis